MYVVVSVRGCSYFVVRQLRYEVLVDFLSCKNLKNVRATELEPVFQGFCKELGEILCILSHAQCTTC